MSLDAIFVHLSSGFKIDTLHNRDRCANPIFERARDTRLRRRNLDRFEGDARSACNASSLDRTKNKVPVEPASRRQELRCAHRYQVAGHPTPVAALRSESLVTAELSHRVASQTVEVQFSYSRFRSLACARFLKNVTMIAYSIRFSDPSHFRHDNLCSVACGGWGAALFSVQGTTGAQSTAFGS